MMKVKNLIEELNKLNPEAIVIMSGDGEGNQYSPLADIVGENMVYSANSTWEGDIGYKKLTPELIKDGYTEEDIKLGKDCIILYPTN